MDRRIWAMSHHERAGDINNVYVYQLTGRGRSPPPLLAPNIYTYFTWDGRVRKLAICLAWSLDARFPTA